MALIKDVNLSSCSQKAFDNERNKITHDSIDSKKNNDLEYYATNKDNNTIAPILTNNISQQEKIVNYSSEVQIANYYPNTFQVSLISSRKRRLEEDGDNIGGIQLDKLPRLQGRGVKSFEPYKQEHIKMHLIHHEDVALDYIMNLKILSI